MAVIRCLTSCRTHHIVHSDALAVRSAPLPRRVRRHPSPDGRPGPDTPPRRQFVSAGVGRTSAVRSIVATKSVPAWPSRPASGTPAVLVRPSGGVPSTVSTKRARQREPAGGLQGHGVRRRVVPRRAQADRPARTPRHAESIVARVLARAGSSAVLKVSTRVVGRAWKPKRRRARTVGGEVTGTVGGGTTGRRRPPRWSGGTRRRRRRSPGR